MTCLAIVAGSHGIGSVVVGDDFLFRVDVQHLTAADGDVGQVAQRGRIMSDLNVGCGTLAGANAVKEVRLMAERHHRFSRRSRISDGLVLIVPQLQLAAFADEQHALCTAPLDAAVCEICGPARQPLGRAGA